MPTPLHVVPLVEDLGVVAGQQLVLLSVEVYDEWADLRFARTDVGAARPLPRRVPPVDAWRIVAADGAPVQVVDCVGRGDRGFTNGEARLVPAPLPGTTLHVSVALVPGEDAHEATITV